MTGTASLRDVTRGHDDVWKGSGAWDQPIDQRLLFETFFSADKNIVIGRPRVLCDYGLFPDVQTFDVSTACL